MGLSDQTPVIQGGTDGTEIGNVNDSLKVSVTNDTGASAVNIQDGGNSITVDGTISATQSGTWTVQPGNTQNTTPWLVRPHDGTDAGQITPNGDLEVVDYLDHGGTQGTVSVTSSATPIHVGGSNLTNRKVLTIYNDSSLILYWGFTNSVTTSNGTPLEKKQFISLPVGPNTTIYMIAVSGSNTVRITESA